MLASEPGQDREPFKLTYDPRFFYTSPEQLETYARILSGIHAREGLFLLVGDSGTGKTALLRRMADDLGASGYSAFFLCNPARSFDELVALVCEQASLPKASGVIWNPARFAGFISSHVDHPVLLVDEADSLSTAVLETLCKCALQPDERELQVVLAGQASLESKLKMSELDSFVARAAHLQPLLLREVRPFINHQLRIAGHDNDQLFTREAIERIARYSKGLPGRINALCGNAMLIAEVESLSAITEKTIEQVYKEQTLGETLSLTGGEKLWSQTADEDALVDDPFAELDEPGALREPASGSLPSSPAVPTPAGGGGTIEELFSRQPERATAARRIETGDEAETASLISGPWQREQRRSDAYAGVESAAREPESPDPGATAPRPRELSEEPITRLNDDLTDERVPSARAAEQRAANQPASPKAFDDEFAEASMHDFGDIDGLFSDIELGRRPPPGRYAPAAPRRRRGIGSIIGLALLFIVVFLMGGGLVYLAEHGVSTERGLRATVAEVAAKLLQGSHELKPNREAERAPPQLQEVVSDAEIAEVPVVVIEPPARAADTPESPNRDEPVPDSSAAAGSTRVTEAPAPDETNDGAAGSDTAPKFGDAVPDADSGVVTAPTRERGIDPELRGRVEAEATRRAANPQPEPDATQPRANDEARATEGAAGLRSNVTAANSKVASGPEDTPIALRFPLDASTLPPGATVQISGVPSPYALSPGRPGNGGWIVDAAELHRLQVTPSSNSDKGFTATATVSDANGLVLSTLVKDVFVEPVADPPSLVVSAANGDQYTPIPLQIEVDLSDRDGSESLAVAVTGLPRSVTLSAGERLDEGTWMLTRDDLEELILTPGAGSPRELNLTVTATATEQSNGHRASSSADVRISVVPAEPLYEPRDPAFN